MVLDKRGQGAICGDVRDFEFPNRRHKGKPVPWHELVESEIMFRHRRAG